VWIALSARDMSWALPVQSARRPCGMSTCRLRWLVLAWALVRLFHGRPPATAERRLIADPNRPQANGADPRAGDPMYLGW